MKKEHTFKSRDDNKDKIMLSNKDEDIKYYVEITANNLPIKSGTILTVRYSGFFFVESIVEFLIDNQCNVIDEANNVYVYSPRHKDKYICIDKEDCKEIDKPSIWERLLRYISILIKK